VLETLPSGERPKKKDKKTPARIYPGGTINKDDSIKIREFVKCLLGRPLEDIGSSHAYILLTAEEALQTAPAFAILM